MSVRPGEEIDSAGLHRRESGEAFSHGGVVVDDVRHRRRRGHDSFSGTDLLEAIRRALATNTPDPGTESHVAEIQERVKLLTHRETEVFPLVVAGMLN
jgi:hypothetical protein